MTKLRNTADTLTSWHYNEGWYNGMTATYIDPDHYKSADLAVQHQAMANTILAANPANIASGHYQNAIDHMGAIKIGMAAQGCPIPESGTNSETAYTDYQNA